MSINFNTGNILDWAKDYTGPAFHAVICDPPYELGFMGKKWDSSGVAFNPETWAALLPHLLPGAFGMAFAASRGYHRMAVAIEDAGFIIHPSIFLWAYGSGFPKATRIDTAIDKAAGAERIEVPNPRAKQQTAQADTTAFGSKAANRVTLPATEEAAAWAGHRYGLQAMKPAAEPVIVFQKPYDGRAFDCITGSGAGAINIDAGRISAEPWNRSTETKQDIRGGRFHAASEAPAMPFPPQSSHEAGRWPSNLILMHLPECGRECAPGCAVAAMAAQSGIREVSGTAASGREHIAGGSAGVCFNDRELIAIDLPNDEGTAARFYFAADFAAEVEEQLLQADGACYVAKAGKEEREAGLERFTEHTRGMSNGAKAAMIRGEEYESSNNGLNTTVTRRNDHPTVKPLSLSRYLSGLLLPPAKYGPRRLLNPFSGSGSEAIGAMLAGWEEVESVDLSAHYCEIAAARAKFWQDRQFPTKPGAVPQTGAQIIKTPKQKDKHTLSMEF